MRDDAHTGHTPLHTPLSQLPVSPLPYGQNIRMLFISAFEVLTMISRPARSELCLYTCWSAARCNLQTPRANPHLDRGRGGSILACGSGLGSLGATPSRWSRVRL